MVKSQKKSWWKYLFSFILGGSLITTLVTILDLPEKIKNFRNTLSGKTPIERVLQTETPRSLSDDLTLLLIDINPTTVVHVQNGQHVLRLTVNQEHLARLQDLAGTPGFETIARLQIDRTSVIMNQVGLAGRINDIHPIGQLTPVDIELLRPLRQKRQ